jgi:lipopolysaccharide biosynthesis regulator YciM
MIVEDANDADAADALSAVASDPALADQIATRLVDCLAEGAAESSVRLRLTQALVDIPGSTASRALADLSDDEDRAVALTATYIRRQGNAR